MDDSDRTRNTSKSRKRGKWGKTKKPTSFPSPPVDLDPNRNTIGKLGKTKKPTSSPSPPPDEAPKENLFGWSPLWGFLINDHDSHSHTRHLPLFGVSCFRTPVFYSHQKKTVLILENKWPCIASSQNELVILVLVWKWTILEHKFLAWIIMFIIDMTSE